MRCSTKPVGSEIELIAVLQKKMRGEVDLWSASSVLLMLVVVTPLVAVLAGVFDAGPKWGHVSSTVLGNYLANTAILVGTVSVLSIAFAVWPAWLVSTCDFPGRRLFEWALVMPLAIPTYVSAFVFFQLVETSIPLQVAVRNRFGVDAFLAFEKIFRYGLLSISMAGVLFPYLFIGARASFSLQSRAAIEASRVLGKSGRYTFFHVALPLARPAMVAGLCLILMEVVNDYGAVNFFGVPTLTEGIFRTWFGLQDRASALRIAGFAMLVILAIIAFERSQRGGARFSDVGNTGAPVARRKLSGLRMIGAMAVCFTPLLVGLIYPLFHLISWAGMTFEKVLKVDFVMQLGRSIALSLATAFVVTGFVVVLAYAAKLRRSKWLQVSNRFATMGYAAPGAVVAIGVIVIFGAFDQFAGRAVISGTLGGICFAYLVRFLAVAYHPVRAGMERTGFFLDESSRSLGKSRLETLFRIQLPLIRGTLLAATMLVFVDILKELPLTMILRPANFETLSTTAFSLAKEGRIHECAVPSLLIVFSAGCGLVILNRFMKRDGEKRTEN